MANKKTSGYAALPGGSITSTWLYDIANPGVLNYKGTHAEVSQNVGDETVTGLTTTATNMIAAINEIMGGGSSAYVKRDGTLPLTSNWDAGNFKITAAILESDIATGTPPFTVASTTKVASLNVDQVDGFDMDQAVLIASSPTHVGLTLSGLSVAGGIVQTDGAGVLNSSQTVSPTLIYSSHPTFTIDEQIVDKKYVDDAVTSSAGVIHDVLTVSSPGQTAFTLSSTAVNPDRSILSLNGQIRTYTTDFTISGTTLTWNDPGGVTLKTTDDFHVWYDIDVAPSPVQIFAAYNPLNINSITGDNTLADIIFNTEDADIGSNYNTTTGVFTAPFNGLYQFDINLYVDGLGAGHTDGYINLNVTGAATQNWLLRRTNPTNDVSSSTAWVNSGTTVVKLTAGDAVKFQLLVGNAAKTVNISSGSRFSGRLIQKI